MDGDGMAMDMMEEESCKEAAFADEDDDGAASEYSMDREVMSSEDADDWEKYGGKREAVRQLFKPPEATKENEETGYYGVMLITSLSIL